MQADSSVDGLLQSLGLEKYQITFQAEEVCTVQDTVFFFLFFLSFFFPLLNGQDTVFLTITAGSFLYLVQLFILYMQVDMTALLHMNDDDLKALGIPMVT